jgi:hypothetical protein
MSDQVSESPPRDLAALQVALQLDAPSRTEVEQWRDWYAAHNRSEEVIYGDHVDACNEYLEPDYLDLLTR